MAGAHDGFGGQFDDRTQLRKIRDEITALNTDKGWRQDGADGIRSGPWFAAYIALAHSELSEALDAYRVKDWSSTRELQPGETIPKPMGVGPELADALIRILDLCEIWDIDIEAEMRRVLSYGWTRPYQHGGKVL